jgi:hypothetical protein
MAQRTSSANKKRRRAALSACLAAASSLGLSGEFDAFLNSTSSNGLPTSIDIGKSRPESSKMGLSLDATISSLSVSAGASIGGCNNLAGSYQDSGSRRGLEIANSADNSSLSTSFSIPVGYGLGFGNGTFQGSL